MQSPKRGLGTPAPSQPEAAGADAARFRSDGRPASEDEHQLNLHHHGSFLAAGRGGAFSTTEGATVRGAFRARLSWDSAASPQNIVIHLGAFLVDHDSTVPVGNIYYSVHHDNDRSKDGSTERVGRRRHGSKSNDETITVNVPFINSDVARIVFIAYIQDADPLAHTFGDLVNGQVILSCQNEATSSDDEAGDVDLKDPVGIHKLDADYLDGFTVVSLGELHRRTLVGARSRLWTYREIGQEYTDLVEVGRMYGVPFIVGDE